MAFAFIEAPFGSDAYPELLQLRREILRLPLGLDFTSVDLATELYDFHLAALESSQLVACVVLHPIDASTIRLRQLAVVPSARNRGIGTKLVGHAEQFAVAHGYSAIEMHARQSAQPFYETLGYVTEGSEFIEVTIPHIKMRKQLVEIMKCDE
jgi:predicted GNAT family N-acyltransferase